MTKTINVTQDDIDNGSIGSSEYCPIALAARRVFTDATIITVSRFMLMVCKGDDVFKYPLPVIASNFVFDYDEDCDTVCPINFEVKENKS